MLSAALFRCNWQKAPWGETVFNLLFSDVDFLMLETHKYAACLLGLSLSL